MLIYEMYIHLLHALLHVTIISHSLGHTSDSCSRKCLEENVFGFRGTSEFNHCMKQCTLQQGISWPLNNTDTCEKDTPDREEGKNVCAAHKAWASVYKVALSSEFRQHLIVYWQPCAVALEHLDGYQIELDDTSVSGSYVDCIQVSLTRNLILNDTNTEYAVFFSGHYLEYSKNYTVTIHGFPMKVGNVILTLDFRSSSCSDLNGYGNCICGLEEFKPLPPPNVTVSGYLVKITVQPLKSCFFVMQYIVNIRLMNGTDAVTAGTGTNFRGRLSNGRMTESFYPLYLANDANLQFVVKYRAISRGFTQSDSEPMPIKIAPWTPCKPHISIDGADVTVTWCCAPAVYNVSRYEIKLVHNVSQSNVFLVNSTCRNHDTMSKTIVRLSHGTYSAQIREWRSPGYKSHATWSSVSNTVQLSKNEGLKKHLIVIAIAIIAVVTIVALIVTMLCYKRLCKKVQRLPESVRNAIGGTSIDQVHVCKTVWVVWQADSQNDSVAGAVHSENVRHLGSFLANHCGLHVILDQFEVTKALSLSSWLKDKQKAADTVIFVCPHQSVTELDCSLNQLVGNFLSVYNLYESALLFENFSVKFASVVLPYSRPTFYAEAKMLLHKIPSFKLMDDIDNLYFFIQNRAKAGPYGRFVLEYVNGCDYSKTEEGANLKAGFQEMVQILNGEGQSLITSTQEISMLTQETILTEEFMITQSSAPLQERELEICDIADQEMLRKHDDEFEPHPPPPIHPQEDADRTVFMINTSDLLSQQPIESECIEAVTFDSNCPLLSPSPIATMSL